MDSNKKTARLAGLAYLVVVVMGIISIAYIPSKLIVRNDAATTFNNIVANESLFRWGVLCGVMCYTAFLVLPLVLYKLLKPIDKTAAVLMVALSVVSVPMSFINMGNKLTVLELIQKANGLQGLELTKLQEQVQFYLHAYSNGNQMASIFWGLWLLPFGYLVYKSGFLPKFLGVCLMFGCFGYLTDFVGDLLYPNYGKTIVAQYISIPGSIGEIGICLWLLIMGVKNDKHQ